MIKIRTDSVFEQMYRTIRKEDADMSSLIADRIVLFQNNPNDTRLHNHPLHKRLEGRWAFAITDDIRVIYRWIGTTTVRLLAIGRHEVVYKKSS